MQAPSTISAAIAVRALSIGRTPSSSWQEVRQVARQPAVRFGWYREAAFLLASLVPLTCQRGSVTLDLYAGEFQGFRGGLNVPQHQAQ
jgi:hypothetical protein